MDKILESEYLNKDSWKKFQEKLVYFCENAEFVKELKNTKIIYNTFYKQAAEISNIESLLQSELKLQFWFYGCEIKKFILKFKKLPFITKVLLLKYCEEKKFIQITVSEKEELVCIEKIDKVKKQIAHKVFDFSDKGFKQTFLPLKSFMTLIQYNCLDISKATDQMSIEFFAKYLNHNKIKEELENSFLYNFYCDLFFSSKIYNDFTEKYNSGEIIKKIDSENLNFIKKDVKEEPITQDNSDDEIKEDNKFLAG